MERFLGFPEIASEHGARLDHVSALVHWLMIVMFVLWTGLFLYMLFRFSKKRNPRADHDGLKSKATNYVEIAVVVAEVVLLVGFSIPLYSERVGALPPASEAVSVRVIAEQFAWNFHYPGPDGVFGRRDVKLVDVESNPLGLDRKDPAAADDVTTVNQLHLPVGKPVIVHLSSKDVIHGFGVPELRVKQDAVPGLSFPVWFVPTVTTAEMRAKTGKPDFEYEIGCAQLCGLGHYRMRAFITIHTQEEFASWMDEQQKALKAAAEGGGDFWG